MNHLILKRKSLWKERKKRETNFLSWHNISHAFTERIKDGWSLSSTNDDDDEESTFIIRFYTAKNIQKMGMNESEKWKCVWFQRGQKMG